LLMFAVDPSLYVPVAENRPCDPTGIVAVVGTIATDCNVRTVTVAVAVTEAPAAFVTVKVYVVLAAGVTVFDTPLETALTPLSMLAVPFAKTAVRALDPPCFTEAGDAAKLVILAAATTVIVTELVVDVPASLVTVKV
jgi:hypothetical protein